MTAYQCKRTININDSARMAPESLVRGLGSKVRTFFIRGGTYSYSINDVFIVFFFFFWGGGALVIILLQRVKDVHIRILSAPPKNTQKKTSNLDPL